MKLGNLGGRMKTFVREARQELRNVNWPTRKEAAYLTGVVIGLSIVLAGFLGLFDYLFIAFIKNLLG